MKRSAEPIAVEMFLIFDRTKLWPKYNLSNDTVLLQEMAKPMVHGLELVQSYPGYPHTFGQRGFISCSDKRNCSDNPNEIFLVIYILL